MVSVPDSSVLPFRLMPPNRGGEMKRFKFLLFVVVLVGCATLAYAGLDEGKAVHDAGDYVTAYSELKPLAEQGDAEAQRRLGWIFDFGEGVPQDYAEAMKWYRRAADQGDANAQFHMGVMYADGKGVPKDLVQAHMWFNLAGARGLAAARGFREQAAEKMTPAQIAEAQRLAREWRLKGKD
jgi:TPR repeat protein